MESKFFKIIISLSVLCTFAFYFIGCIPQSEDGRVLNCGSKPVNETLPNTNGSSDGTTNDDEEINPAVGYAVIRATMGEQKSDEFWFERASSYRRRDADSRPVDCTFSLNKAKISQNLVQELEQSWNQFSEIEFTVHEDAINFYCTGLL